MRRLLSNGRIMRRQSILFIVPIVLILAFVLAACGTNSGSGTSTGSTGSTPVPTAPTTLKGTAMGCPSDAVVNASPVRPNVTILLTNSNSTIVAHNGDLIEVRLPFGQQWSVPITSGNALQLQTPAGYAVSADKVCVWHFIARNTGTAELSFSAKAICKTGQMCPLYIMRVPFTIDVK